jgi:cytochrome c2
MRFMLLGGIIFAGIFGVTAIAHAQDAAAGEQVFKSQCSICHSPQPNRNIIGPSLFSVVGRHSGLIPGFHYSSANRNSGLVWDVSTLDRYLTGPRQVVPGTLMTYPGLKDSHQRADLIAYLATLR